MLKTLWIAPVVATAWLLGLSGPVAADDSLLQAKLDGFGQVPPPRLSPQEWGNFMRASIRTEP